MLEKRKILKHLEVQPDGKIFIKEINQILENGVVVSENPHRTYVEPTDDVSTNEHQLLKDIAGKIWTPKLKSDFILEKKRINDENLARIAANNI